MMANLLIKKKYLISNYWLLYGYKFLMRVKYLNKFLSYNYLLRTSTSNEKIKQTFFCAKLDNCRW